MAYRLQKMGQEKYKNGFEVTCHEDLLSWPAEWKKSRLIFVNSMGDLFHGSISKSFLWNIFCSIMFNNQHFYQILTKRSDSMKNYMKNNEEYDHVWFGVTVENMDNAYRIDDLKNTDVKHKFVSFEPLLGNVSDCNLKGIDWVIAGGETGSKARSTYPKWFYDLKNKCDKENIPFFLKQWGKINQGEIPNELKQFPKEFDRILNQGNKNAE